MSIKTKLALTFGAIFYIICSYLETNSFLADSMLGFLFFYTGYLFCFSAYFLRFNAMVVGRFQTRKEFLEHFVWLETASAFLYTLACVLLTNVVTLFALGEVDILFGLQFLVFSTLNLVLFRTLMLLLLVLKNILTAYLFLFSYIGASMILSIPTFMKNIDISVIGRPFSEQAGVFASPLNVAIGYALLLLFGVSLAKRVKRKDLAL